MKKCLLIAITTLSSLISFSQDVLDKMPEELSQKLKDARYCGEAVIKSYDTVLVGATWMLDKINYFRLDINSNQFSTILPTGRKGIWPKVGDTCLVIVDKKCDSFKCPVSSFAKITHDKYVFWNPYTADGSTFEMDKSSFMPFYKKINWQFAKQ